MNSAVTVREAMTQDYVGVSESDGLVEAASLLVDEETDGAVVLRGQEPVGMLTVADVLASLVGGEPREATVGDWMTESVPMVSPDRTIEQAADLLFTRSARQLVVTGPSDDVLGVLTRADIVAATALTPGETEDRPGVELASPETSGQTQGDGGFSEQGICEGCGALTADLVSFNGQLLCGDCRDV